MYLTYASKRCWQSCRQCISQIPIRFARSWAPKHMPVEAQRPPPAPALRQRAEQRVEAWAQGQKALFTSKRFLARCHHPEVDGIWGRQGIYQGSFKDQTLSTPGWLQVYYDMLALPIIPPTKTTNYDLVGTKCFPN